jgi:septum formation inhibitor MinC
MRDTKDRERVLLVDVSTALNSALAVGMVEAFATRFADPPERIQFGMPHLKKVNLNAGPILLTPGVLTKIRQILRGSGFVIDTVYSKVPQTQMAALDEGYFVRDSLMSDAAQEATEMFSGLTEDQAYNEVLLKERIREKMASLDAVLDTRKPASRGVGVSESFSPQPHSVELPHTDMPKLQSYGSYLDGLKLPENKAGKSQLSEYAQPDEQETAYTSLNNKPLSGYATTPHETAVSSQPISQSAITQGSPQKTAASETKREGYTPSRLLDRLQEIQNLQAEINAAAERQQAESVIEAPAPEKTSVIERRSGYESRVQNMGQNALGIEASVSMPKSPPTQPKETYKTQAQIDLPPGVTQNTLKASDIADVDLPYVLQPKVTVPTLLVKQNLRSGQVLRYDGHIVVLGDVHAGAEISATGDVVVWGELKGIAHAGSKGNGRSEIRALRIEAIQLRIADFIARRPDRIYYHKDQLDTFRTGEVARVADGEIKIFQDVI